MLVEENYTNETTGYRIGDSGLYEPFTEDKRRLFLAYQREFGRCIGKVYIDTADGTKAVGWVFEKREKYSDCNEYYIQHTWVTLHSSHPERKVKYNYLYL